MSANKDADWFYLDPSSKPVGPVSFNDLRLLCAKGVLKADDKVWSGKPEEEWKEVSEVSGLMEMVVTAPAHGGESDADQEESGNNKFDKSVKAVNYKDVENRYGYKEDSQAMAKSGFLNNREAVKFDVSFRCWNYPIMTLPMLVGVAVAILSLFVTNEILFLWYGLAVMAGGLALALLGMFITHYNFYRMLSNDDTGHKWIPLLNARMAISQPILTTLSWLSFAFFGIKKNIVIYLVLVIACFVLTMYNYYLLTFKGKASHEAIVEKYGIARANGYNSYLFGIAMTMNAFPFGILVSVFAMVFNILICYYMWFILRNMKKFEKVA